MRSGERIAIVTGLRLICVSRMLCISNTKQLISSAHVSDYVMSNETIAMCLAMVAECREVNAGGYE
jgi:hypothetical protein